MDFAAVISEFIEAIRAAFEVLIAKLRALNDGEAEEATEESGK